MSPSIIRDKTISCLQNPPFIISEGLEVSNEELAVARHKAWLRSLPVITKADEKLFKREAAERKLSRWLVETEHESIDANDFIDRYRWRQVPLALLQRFPQLGSAAQTLCCLYADPHVKKTGSTYEKNQRLANRYGVSIRTLNRHLQQLKQLGLIFMHIRPGFIQTTITPDLKILRPMFEHGREHKPPYLRMPQFTFEQAFGFTWERRLVYAYYIKRLRNQTVCGDSARRIAKGLSLHRETVIEARRWLETNGYILCLACGVRREYFVRLKQLKWAC